MVNIHNGSVSKKEKILQLSLKSPVHFGQLFLPKDFRVDTAASYHYEVGYMMDNKTNLKPVIYMLPRGHAKTKLTQASILKDIATSDFDSSILKSHFVVWVAQNKTQSMRNVNFIMSQVESNAKLRYYFGDLRASGKHKWNQEELEFRGGSSLICRAGLHGIRGLLKDELRPNRFILDDFEYEGNTKTEHSRNANANTVTSVILPALDPEIGRLQINQTPVHYDSFVVRIFDKYQEHIKEGGSPESFEWIVYKRATKIGSPLWKELFDNDKLRRIKSRLVQAGQLHTWFQEYEMEVTSDEAALFGQKVLKYWDGELEFQGETPYLNIRSLNHRDVQMKVNVLTFQGCDPASDIETRGSSDIVIIDVAVDPNGNIFVLDYICKKGMPDIALDSDNMRMGTSDQILIRSKKNKTRRSGVEKTGLSSGVFNCIAKIKESEPKFRNVVVTALSHKGERKIDRIYNGLISDFNSGKIYIKPEHSRLETEIKTFGEYAKYMDILDALEMAKRVSYKPAKEKIVVNNGKPLRDEWEIPEEDTYVDSWKTA